MYIFICGRTAVENPHRESQFCNVCYEINSYGIPLFLHMNQSDMAVDACVLWLGLVYIL